MMVDRGEERKFAPRDPHHRRADDVLERGVFRGQRRRLRPFHRHQSEVDGLVLWSRLTASGARPLHQAALVPVPGHGSLMRVLMHRRLESGLPIRRN